MTTQETLSPEIQARIDEAVAAKFSELLQGQIRETLEMGRIIRHHDQPMMLSDSRNQQVHIANGATFPT